MEKGHVRIDANVSIRPVGSEELGVKVEVKNMNSVRNCQRALEVEIDRQIDVVNSGREIIQQTMLFDPVREDVRPMRTKEASDDYRYFPDPDLVPIVVDQPWIDRVQSQIPELPAAKRERFESDLNLSQDQADVLTADRQTAEYFEAVIAVGVEPATAANWVQGDVLRTLNEAKIEIDQLRATPAQLAALIHLIDNGTISANVARKVFAEMASTGDDPSDIVERQGLVQISDESALETTVDELIAAHPDEFARLKEGDKKLQGFFMGQIMKATKGQANPKIASQLLAQKAQ